jgi:hypothetical protein
MRFYRVSCKNGSKDFFTTGALRVIDNLQNCIDRVFQGSLNIEEKESIVIRLLGLNLFRS